MVAGNGGLMFGMELQGATLVREAQRETQAANSARLSFSCHHQASNGVGHFTIDEPVIFDMPFLARPFFAEGAVVKTAPDLSTWGLPQGSACVWQWERNVKGHYIGAYLALSVQVDLLSGGFYLTPPDVEMVHDLVFLGIGYKDLGAEISTLAQVLAPREVGFGSTE